MYEYKVVSLRHELEQAEQYNWTMLYRHEDGQFTPANPERDLLAKMGEDGWKLQAVADSKYYFMRRVIRKPLSFYAKHDLAVRNGCKTSRADTCQPQFTDEFFKTDLFIGKELIGTVVTDRKTGDTAFTYKEQSVDSTTNEEGSTDGQTE